MKAPYEDNYRVEDSYKPRREEERVKFTEGS